MSAAFDVYSSYDDKIPGRFALFIDDSEMAGTFKVTGYQCSFHSYPLDARAAFSQSVAKTIEQVVDQLELVRTTPTTTQLIATDSAGLIRVRGEKIDVDLRPIPGFWTHEMEAEVTLTASFAADGRSGRALGGTVSATGEDKQDSGGACGGGANAISKASEEALENLTRQLGERIANSERLREAATAAVDTPQSQTGTAPPVQVTPGGS
jgi:hypothetical protein